MQNTNNISTNFYIPTELLVLTFSYLNSEDLINLLQVSKNFRKAALIAIFRSREQKCNNYRRRLLLSCIDNVTASYNGKNLNKIAIDGKLEIIQIINSIKSSERYHLENMIIQNLKNSINQAENFNGRIFFNHVGFKILSREKLNEFVEWLLISARKNENHIASLQIWYTLASLFFKMNKAQLFHAYNVMNDIELRDEQIMFAVFVRKMIFEAKFVYAVTNGSTIINNVLDMVVANPKFFCSIHHNKYFTEYDFIGYFAKYYIPRLTNYQIALLTKTVITSYTKIFKFGITIGRDHESGADQLFKMNLKAATASLAQADCIYLFDIARPHLLKNTQLLLFLENIYYNLPTNYKIQVLEVLENLIRSYTKHEKVLQIYNNIISGDNLRYRSKKLLKVSNVITEICESNIEYCNTTQYWSAYYKQLISCNYLVKLKLQSKFNKYEKLLQNNDQSALLGFNIVNLMNLDLRISRRRKLQVIDLILKHDFTLSSKNVPATALMALLKDETTPYAITSKIISSFLSTFISNVILPSTKLLNLLVSKSSPCLEFTNYISKLVNCFYDETFSQLGIARMLTFVITNFDSDKLLISDTLRQLITRQEPFNFFKFIIENTFSGNIKEEVLLNLFNYRQINPNSFIAKIPFETKKQLADYYKIIFLRTRTNEDRYLNDFMYGVKLDYLFDRAFFEKVIRWIVNLEGNICFYMPKNMLHLVRLLRFNISLQLYKEILDLLYREISHSTTYEYIFVTIIFYNSMPNSLDLYSKSEIKAIFTKVIYAIEITEGKYFKSWCKFFLMHSKYLGVLTDEQEQKLLQQLIKTSWKEDIANSDNIAINLLMQLINTKNERNYLAKVRAMLSAGTSLNEIVLSAVVEEKFKKHKPKAKIG